MIGLTPEWITEELQHFHTKLTQGTKTLRDLSEIEDGVSPRDPLSLPTPRGAITSRASADCLRAGQSPLHDGFTGRPLYDPGIAGCWAGYLPD